MSIISSLRLSGIGTPVASRVLTTGSNSQPGWNQIANAHIISAAGIDVSKLAAGTGGQILETVSSTPTWRTRPGCRVTKAAAQNIAAFTLTPINFDAEYWDTSTMHDNVTNNTRITMPITGDYYCFGMVQWLASVTDGGRYLDIRVNGATLIASVLDSNVGGTGGGLGQHVSCVWRFTAGDYIELCATHFSTTNPIIGGITKVNNTSPEFGAYYLGS